MRTRTVRREPRTWRVLGRRAIARGLGPAVAAAIGFAGPAFGFESMCPYGGRDGVQIAAALAVDVAAVESMARAFCANVGKKAYNKIGPRANRELFLGPIVGVTFRNVGEMMSPPGGPDFEAPVSGFLYIIGPGGIADFHFLRWSAEIEGR
ncbi:MAG: hypothetical protein WCF16_03075 [Alphaproteobacteria bacterium]